MEAEEQMGFGGKKGQYKSDSSENVRMSGGGEEKEKIL